VPIIVNSIFPPLPTLARCRDLGAAVATALARSTLGRRVALLATGGISHTVGAPGMERNDPAFDAEFLSALAQGDLGAACSHADARLDAAGNGTHEIRNWVAVAGAMHPARPSVVTDIAFAPGWDSGVHQLLWSTG
jgi:aromatic ring-opening dioxygenase catalytic subunit (LigB family)